MKKFNHGASAVDLRRKVVYSPQEQPGFVAWVSAFDYGNGDIGLSFKETVRNQRERDFSPPTIEEAEAAVVPVSYCSVMCGDADQESFRVYMKSTDGGETFTETGRCPEQEACFCTVGFPDGRILGFESPSLATGEVSFTGGIDIKESLDGGATWRELSHILDGECINMWRVRRLRDGTLILLASFTSTPWGPGQVRVTRNTNLPDEEGSGGVYNPFFLTTTDGVTFSGPHHILAGTNANEYDVVERADGSLLFINGDVQGAKAARQTVHRNGSFWVPGSVLPIQRGAPEDPVGNSQGGFVPETVIMLENGVMVGGRRLKPYTCSVDEGKNWFEIDGIGECLYQPFMLNTPQGILLFGHHGGDISFGQMEMYIGSDLFRLEEHLPRSCNLSIHRCLSEDESHYENRYTVQLLCGDKPLANQKVLFRFSENWNANGSFSTAPREDAPYQIEASTDAEGWAQASAPQYDNPGDIHFSYTVDAVYRPWGNQYLPCASPRMRVYSMRPWRQCRRPYKAYFAQGDLYISHEIEEKFPVAQLLQPYVGQQEGLVPVEAIGQELAWVLVNSHVAIFEGDNIRWKRSVHAPVPLAGVKPMGDGDWYH